MADNLQATPQKRPNIGALAQLLKRIDEFGRKPFGYDNPPVQMLSDLLGVPGTQRTLERLAYGEALTEPRGVLKEDTVDALFNAPGALGKLAGATKGLPIGAVIKPKGGNWLEGSVEGALKGLKNPYVDKYAAELERWGSPEQARQWVADPGDNARAINNWVDKQLTRYVKNEMATPEDPIRALAEKGVLHVRPEMLTNTPRNPVSGPHPLGKPTKLAKSDLAKEWESATDAAVARRYAENFSDAARPSWLAPGVPVYAAESPGGVSLADRAGFSHLIDELRNATNPASGLPPELLLKYSSLPQVSVPQAVERVAQINAWRAAQKAEADLARANNAATVLHKDYPEQGFKWVELKNPESRSINEMNESHRQALADALKYEGDTMGHCVGGYCDDVASGKSRIFSLRDSKGQPHVTIETSLKRNLRSYLETLQDPARPPEGGPLGTKWTLHDRVQRERSGNGDYDVYAKKLLQELGLDTPQEIIQIKGKANRAPNPEYLPFVQDFVRSGKWSDVGDLQNTGLRRVADVFNPMELQTLEQRHGVNPASITDYMTPEEIAQYQSLFTQGR